VVYFSLNILREHQVGWSSFRLTTGHFSVIESIQAEVSHGFHSEPISSHLARHLYASESRALWQKVVHLDTVANTPVRAPGDATASFALESAIDELAYMLKMDPIELRRINEPANDPVSGASFSNRNLMEAYRRGAERFGWKYRHAEPRAHRDGQWLIGQGVATAFHSYIRLPSSARMCLYSDETALVQVAAQEMGMGTATVQIQYAAQQLGLPMNQVSFEYGDSNLPLSPVAGGSGQTVSILAAVAMAIEQLHQELLRLVKDDSPLAGATLQDVEARNGGLFRRDKADQGETYASLLQQAGKRSHKICQALRKESEKPLGMGDTIAPLRFRARP
jgi:xanthine dehydrogenase YagR molybdenum-binding subunit